MAQAETTGWWELIREGGATAVLVIAVTAFIRGWIHTDREFSELKADRDWWRAAATRGTKAAETATDLAVKLADGSPEVR